MRILQKILLFSPILLYRISGNSMLPNYKNGDFVIALKKFANIKINDVVVASDPRDGRFILKRIKDIKDKMYFLIGDNQRESTDSREFGWVKRIDLIGKVLIGYRF